MKKLLLALVSVAALGGAKDASACSCMPHQAPREALSRASAVFLGTATKVEQVISEHAFRQKKVTFEVERVWKGSKSRQAVLFTAIHSAACGYGFQEGAKYLVYASTDSTGRLNTSICQRTRTAAQATQDRLDLGAGEEPTDAQGALDARHFAENRSYAHDLFPTPEACQEARKNFPFLNCQQRVNFRTDGTATIMVTDIMNIATYVIEGDKVIVTARPGEIGRPMTFTLSADQRTLTLDANGTIWKLGTR